MASLLSFSLPKPSIIKATSLSPTTTSPSTPEVLEEKFGRKGIKFLESNNVPTVELKVRNGSSVRVQIPNAHVSSYKPKVYWKDDGFEEVLYTLPGKEKDSSGIAKGGIGLVINDASEGGSKGSLISSSEWTVKDVDSDSIDAVQVELSCSSGPLEISYVVSLYPLSMASAVIVKNNGRKDVTLTSAILSHLKFKKRAKAGIQGLRKCYYCTQPPLSSPFEVLSPSEALKPESPGLLDFDFEPEEKPGIMHKIEETLNIGGKKDEHKGETQGGYKQQDHRGDAQGERKEGFVDQMKDKLPGGGGHKGETQGGYKQQEHRGDAQGERKEGFLGQIKDKIPGVGGGSGAHGEGGEKKKKKDKKKKDDGHSSSSDSD